MRISVLAITLSTAFAGPAFGETRFDGYGFGNDCVKTGMGYGAA